MTCEAYLDSWLGQPINNISNAAYFITAILLLVIYWRKRTRSDFYFSVFAFLVGLASTLFHSSHQPLFLYFDYVAQFLFFSYMVTLGIHTIEPTPRLQRIFVFAFLSLSAAILYKVEKSFGIPIVAILSALFVATKVLGFRSARKKGLEVKYFYLGLTIFLFGIGFLFFLMDYRRIDCNPNNHFFQYHAVWHILVAVAMYTLAKFYRQFRMV